MKLIFPSRKEVHFTKPQAATNFTNAIWIVFDIRCTEGASCNVFYLHISFHSLYWLRRAKGSLLKKSVSGFYNFRNLRH